MRRPRVLSLLVSGAVAGALTVAGGAVLAPPAQAAVGWTPVATGTVDEITAVDHQGGQILAGTSNGKILYGPEAGPLTQIANFPGLLFTDVDLSPSGAKGVLSSDQGIRIGAVTGAGWTSQNLQVYNTDGATAGVGDCRHSAAGPFSLVPYQDLVHAAEWVDETTVIAVGDKKTVFRGVAGAVAEINRASDGTCKFNGAGTFTDLALVSPSYIWFSSNWFGELWRTTDGFATPPVRTSNTMANSAGGKASMAIDPSAPTKAQVVYNVSSLQWGSTTNGGSTQSWVAGRPNVPLHDIAGASGIFMAVGDAGAIYRAIGSTAVAIGDGTATNWRAVDMVSPSRAVVAGAGGRMILTNNANAAITPPGGGAGFSPLPPASDPPIAGKGAVVKGGYVRLKVRGRLGLPAGVTKAAGCKGKVKLQLKKKSRTLAKTKTRVRSTCVFKKTIRVKRSKVGSAKKLKLVVQFGGNAAVGKSRASYRVRVR